MDAEYDVEWSIAKLEELRNRRPADAKAGQWEALWAMARELWEAYQAAPDDDEKEGEVDHSVEEG